MRVPARSRRLTVKRRCRSLVEVDQAPVTGGVTPSIRVTPPDRRPRRIPQAKETPVEESERNEEAAAEDSQPPKGRVRTATAADARNTHGAPLDERRRKGRTRRDDMDKSLVGHVRA